MPKGKPWSHDEEVRLKKLAQEGKSIDVIAVSLGKSEDAVYHKCKRLGLLVEEGARGLRSSSLKIPKELPTVEELMILADALKAVTQPDLEKADVQRLQTVATLARIYKEFFADYVDYREIETELVKLRKKYDDLVKGRNYHDHLETCPPCTWLAPQQSGNAWPVRERMVAHRISLIETGREFIHSSHFVVPP